MFFIITYCNFHRYSPPFLFYHFFYLRQTDPENVELDDLIKKIDDRIAELEKSDKLNNVSPYQEDTEQKLSETKKEENVNEFLKFANSINDDIMNEQKIEKPKINVDADSIMVDENITDDEFFDDFFGDD